MFPYFDGFEIRISRWLICGFFKIRIALRELMCADGVNRNGSRKGAEKSAKDAKDIRVSEFKRFQRCEETFKLRMNCTK